MQKLLTIVVPVYKVEKYINKCLDSLLLDDPSLMELLEVIIVNDGTPDRSADYSREYVKRFPGSFRQIDKENGGHGSAWNTGLEVATGKYIRFLDSDDWLTDLSVFMKKLSGANADLVITRVRRYYENTGEINISSTPKTIDCLLPINCIGASELDEYNTATNFWFSTYKTSWLKLLSPLFLEGIQYDDAILYVAPLICSKTYIAFDLILYNYRLGREGQSMNLERQVNRISDRLKVLRQMEQFIASHEIKNEYIHGLLNTIMNDRRLILVNLISKAKPYKLAARFNRELKSIGTGYITPRSKQSKRYLKYPFSLFYLIEQGRFYYNKILIHVQ